MSGTPQEYPFNEAAAGTQLAVLQTYLIAQYRYLYAAGMRHVQIPQILKISNGGNNNSSIINKLTWIDGAYDFMDLTPDQMSQLVPQIRLYKQLYNDGTPTEEIEFVIPNKINTSILLEDTTDQGVGIKNFQYKYVGSNPATVRNDIEAKLTLYFQNFSELLRNRTSPSGETYAFVDLFSRSRKIIAPDCEEGEAPTTQAATPNARAPLSFVTRVDDEGTRALTEQAERYQQLIGQFETAPERNQYNGPIEFEIKAVVGWAVPKGNTTLTPKQIEAIESCSQAFFLTLIDHDFSFEQDGTFTVELNYRARLGAILDSPQLDILRLDQLGTGELDLNAQKWVDDAGFGQIYEGTAAQILQQVQSDLKNAKYSCDEEAVEFIQARLDRLTDNFRGGRYRKIADYLISKDLMYSEEVGNDVLNTWANTERLEPGGEFTDAQLRDRDPYHGRGYETDRTIVNNVDSTLTQLASTEDPESFLGSFFDSDFDGSFRQKAWESASNDKIAFDQAVHKITYFMFGDLLNFVVEEAKKESIEGVDGVLQGDLDRIKVLLGECTFGGGTFNIANIPISWEAFKNFWYKKVIKPKRDSYPLLQFIRDVLRDLLFGSLSSVYYNAGTRKFNYSFKTAFISLPGIGDGTNSPLRSTDPLTLKAQGRDQDGNPTLDLEPFTLREPLSILRHNVQTQHMFHYLCIFVDNGQKGQFARSAMNQIGFNPRVHAVDKADFQGQYTSQRRAYNRDILNIHHFGFGEDRGILKSANFSKTDQPYLRESRYLERGGDPFVQLSNVYEASITCFGAPFFYPGQYIWINPYGLSKSKNASYRLGSPDAGPVDANCGGGSFANLMGLGGYHIIIDVEGIIEDGLYEININARFDNSGADLGDREGYNSNDTKRCPDKQAPASTS